MTWTLYCSHCQRYVPAAPQTVTATGRAISCGHLRADGSWCVLGGALITYEHKTGETQRTIWNNDAAWALPEERYG